eukprot:1110219-Alexandrium_andersonii.AAC.1
MAERSRSPARRALTGPSAEHMPLRRLSSVGSRPRGGLPHILSLSGLLLRRERPPLRATPP